MLKFRASDWFFLGVSPMKEMMWFRRRKDFNDRYIELFEILWTIGEVAYELAFPSDFSALHQVFYSSMLVCYVLDESHVLH